MSEKLLEIDNLRVIYKTDEGVVQALNGLSFHMDKGETLGLVGETGAGKTTTALSILKLLPDKIGLIEDGSIKFNDFDIVTGSEQNMRKLRGDKISMIFQDPMTSLNPIIKIGDQIAEVLELHRADMTKSEIEARVDEILTTVGLPTSRKDEYPHQFSGGMRQRVVIAMALTCEPQLLLADEPTTALDVTIQAQVLELMKKLKENLNTSMLLITHDLGVVADICDRVAIMYAGTVVEMGTIEDIFEASNHHPYTIGLFGSIPDLENDAERLNPIKGLMPDPMNLPTGCYFHDRCQECMEICTIQEPDNHIVDEKTNHMIKCHLFDRTKHSDDLEGKMHEPAFN